MLYNIHGPAKPKKYGLIIVCYFYVYHNNISSTELIIDFFIYLQVYILRYGL
jgi:hypothetical protein